MVLIVQPKYLKYRDDFEDNFGIIAAEYLDTVINSVELALQGAYTAAHGLTRATKLDAAVEGFCDGMFHFCPDGNVGSNPQYIWLAENYGFMFSSGMGVSPSPLFVSFQDQDSDIHLEIRAKDDYLDMLFGLYVGSMQQTLFTPRDDLDVRLEDYSYPVNRRDMARHKKLILDPWN